MRTIVLAAVALMAAGPELQAGAARPLPDRTRCRQVTAGRPWARDLKQIPSTVIDKGVLRHVPYTSYRAGEYELNVYGDPAAPAGFEIGIHGDLLKRVEAKKNCFDLVAGLLDDPADRLLAASLKQDVDKKARGALTFEVTPPTAEDAYGGWWVSVYSEAALDRSRATPQELAKITTTRQDVKLSDAAKREAAPLPVDPVTQGRWGAEDLASARSRKDVPEEKQAVYAPAYSRKGGVYVPDRTIDDTGYILFICANSDRHEDREEILKVCPVCRKDDTFFWDNDRKCFISFQCGAPYDNALVKCTICGRPPKRVRTKHK